MEYYCLGKNHASELLNSKFIRCQNPYQRQNIKILSTFQREKTPTWGKFLKFEFFLSEKIWLYRYYQNKNQFPVTSSSHINLTMKLLIKLYLLHQK